MGNCRSKSNTENGPGNKRGLQVLYHYKDNFVDAPPSATTPTARHVHSMSTRLIEIIQSLERKNYENAYSILYDSNILKTFGYSLKSSNFEICQDLECAKKAASKAMHWFPPTSKLLLPEVYVGTPNDIQMGTMKTAENDPDVARSVLPVILEEWIHMFQFEIGGYLSPDTSLFMASSEGQHIDRDKLNEVDICAFYRDLGWHDILPDFYERYHERALFRQFIEGRNITRASATLLSAVPY
jgi:hypothetical protein